MSFSQQYHGSSNRLAIDWIKLSSNPKAIEKKQDSLAIVLFKKISRQFSKKLFIIQMKQKQFIKMNGLRKYKEKD